MKKVLKFNFMVVLIAFALASCSKDQELNSIYEDNPSFYIKGFVGRDSLNIVAGENNYELFTDYIINQDSVLILRGRMQSTNSQNTEALAIWIRTNTKMTGNAINLNITQEIKPLAYPFTSTNLMSAKPGEYSITAIAEAGGTNYNWSSPVGTYAGTQNVINIENQNGSVPVSLTADFGACSSEITHFINPNSTCDASFDLNTSATALLTASIKTRNGAAPVSTRWFVNNQSIQLGTGNILPALVSVNDEVKAEFTFADGCKKTVSRKVASNAGVLANCNVDFTYAISAITTLNPEQLGTVEIIYTSSNGTRYTSKSSEPIGMFNLENVGDFERNEQNMATKRFSFSATTKLMAADGTALTLNSLFGNFAVAYPD